MQDSYTNEDGRNRRPAIKRDHGSGLMVAMIIIVALVAAIAYFLFAQEARKQRQSDAVISAAESVGDAARDASTAISDAARRIAPKD